jgi:16S rRNA (guanine527-N7)-methyltransferase
VDRASLEQRLHTGAEALGVRLGPAEVEGFFRYAKLLLRWNRRIDLTSIDEHEGVIDRHFLDSLAIVPHLAGDIRRVVDVGSGAGLPGLPLAMVRPDLEVVLVESRLKRAAFLRAAAAEVGSQARVRAARAEDLVGEPPWDLAVSRAMLPPPEWLALGRKLARRVAVWTARPTKLHATKRVQYRLPDGFQGVIELYEA